MTDSTFSALVLRQGEDQRTTAALEEPRDADLTEGDAWPEGE